MPIIVLSTLYVLICGGVHLPYEVGMHIVHFTDGEGKHRALGELVSRGRICKSVLLTDSFAERQRETERDRERERGEKEHL
jgi:hypothetical protein